MFGNKMVWVTDYASKREFAINPMQVKQLAIWGYEEDDHVILWLDLGHTEIQIIGTRQALSNKLNCDLPRKPKTVHA